jgi:hypothetical protein
MAVRDATISAGGWQLRSGIGDRFCQSTGNHGLTADLAEADHAGDADNADTRHISSWADKNSAHFSSYLNDALVLGNCGQRGRGIVKHNTFPYLLSDGGLWPFRTRLRGRYKLAGAHQPGTCGHIAARYTAQIERTEF